MAPNPHRVSRLAVSGLLLIFTLACLLLLVVDFSLASTSACPQHTLQQIHTCSDGRVVPRLVALRDTIITLVFGAPPRHAYRPTATGAPGLTTAKYSKHFVARFNLSTTDEALALKEVVDRMFLDVWAATPSYVDVRVREDDFDGVLSFLPESMASSYTTIIPDLAALAAATYPSPGHADILPNHLPTSNSGLASSEQDINSLFFFKEYQPFPVIVEWMRLLQAMSPGLVEMVNIGTSYEGRDMSALRVGSRPAISPLGQPRKTIIVTGGIHAREWISVTSVNYAAWSFVAGFDREAIITKMLHEFDIVFVPVLNPDGFNYTWEADRLWRKSRQHTNMRWCRGLDLDRAFGFEWDARSDPCSESYGGSEPFQAVEAFQFAEWARKEVRNNNVKFVGLLDLHSYSQQILFPFSYTCAVDPPNLENLEELGIGLVKAIRLTSGEPYSLGAACEGVMTGGDGWGGEGTPRVEVGGGSFMDWIFHELGVHFSYQIRLRDTGTYGFLLPKEYIVPVGEEVLSAVKYFGDFLMGNNGIERGAKFAEDPDEDPEPELRR